MSLYELFFGFLPETKARHPSAFKRGNIDRRKCSRTIPMRVLSLGYSRTGTGSMQAALNELGIPAYHGFDMFSNYPDFGMWADALELKYFSGQNPEAIKAQLDRKFWDQLLGHVGATTDTPCNAFGPELIAAYPDAKVVLVEREIESWYKSFEGSVIRTMEWPGVRILGSVLPYMKDQMRVGWGLMLGQCHAKDFQDFRRRARSEYRKHYAEVRELLQDQPERLLEYDLKDGWEPLCRFLDLPSPDAPFPHINDATAHEEWFRVIGIQWARDAALRLFKFTTPPILLYLTWRYLSSQ